MDRVPSNHRLAERVLIAMVQKGKWRINDDGDVSWADGRPAFKRLPSGYLMVRAMLGGRRVCGLAHRLVWQHFFGDIPAGLTINHRNGVKWQNNPSNLQIATYSEQLKHAHKAGLIDQRGQRNPAAKITDNQVVQMRLAYGSGAEGQAALAIRFGVSIQQVSRIVRGQQRAGQGGAVLTEDQRRFVGERDPATGRNLGKKALPQARVAPTAQ